MIEFESVSKTYRDGTQAVSDLSLVVPSGEITVFVGPSGCGKTTTLRMVNRMLEPSSGRIIWDGQPLRSKRKTTLRRQMGYVIQSGGLFPHRTVLENIGTVPGLLGWDRTKTRKRSRELLDAVGLDRKLGDRYPAQLSGGQQQRVGVARALAADPLVLLMDEPFSAVDPVVRAELHEFFLGLQQELSKTIILITHDIDEAIKLGDQVAILRVGGRLAQAGTPQQLLEEPADAFVEGFVGRDRGYRALSFMPASAVELSSVSVVRDQASAGGDGPVLVLDEAAAPQGWLEPARGDQVMRVGGVFDPQLDTLRVALDSALTSPVGLAVAVSRETGRYRRSGRCRPDPHPRTRGASRVGRPGRRTGGHGWRIRRPAGTRARDAGRRTAERTMHPRTMHPRTMHAADDDGARTRRPRRTCADCADRTTPAEVAPAEETAAEVALAPGMPPEVVAPENPSADDVPAEETAAAASEDPAPDEQVRS